MLKLVSGIAIITFTTLCGYSFSRKYRKRKLFFTQFKEFNERFLNEIAYYRRPIKEFVASYSYQGEFNGVVQSFFENFERKLQDDGLFLDLSACFFLNKEEKGFVEDYFFMLGRGDSASQKSYFSSLKDQLSSLQSEAEGNSKRYGDLYLKIGFLCGLLILILII